jgi:hypothetical protein
VRFVVKVGDVEDFFANKAFFVQRKSVLHDKFNLCVVW